MLYALVRSEHKRFQMLSKFVSANIRIASSLAKKHYVCILLELKCLHQALEVAE